MLDKYLTWNSRISKKHAKWHVRAQ